MQFAINTNGMDAYRTFRRVTALPQAIRQHIPGGYEVQDAYARFVTCDEFGPAGRLCFIYGLIDPVTNEVRYVGKSQRPRERLANHLNERKPCHRTNWLQSLKKQGLQPRLTILAEVYPIAPWQPAEQAWIQYAREQGWPLTNSTDGGDGVPGLSGESKERMLRTWKGRKHSPESLLKIGQASKGRTHTEAYKQFMRQRMSVRIFTEQHRQRISESSRKFTDEQVAEIRARIAAGEKVKHLAVELGVHRKTVFDIKHRKGAYQ